MNPAVTISMLECRKIRLLRGTHIHTHTRAHTHAHTRTYIHEPGRDDQHARVSQDHAPQRYIHTHAYARTYTRTHTHIHTHMNPEFLCWVVGKKYAHTDTQTHTSANYTQFH